MDIAHVQEVEARYEAAQAVVDAARVALEPLSAAYARGQRVLAEAQQALGPIAQERHYLMLQYRMEASAASSRHALDQPRAIFELPPEGASHIAREGRPAPRQFVSEDALREACSHIWLDPESTTRFGLTDDYVTVSTNDGVALAKVQAHVFASFPSLSYRALVKHFAHPQAVGG